MTWTPAACSCRRLRVWVYGGSTTFGLGQRDEHSLPSELARTAAQNGITLDVSNRGVAGATHWTSAQRFAWDIASTKPPDLVIFYDGVNDMGGVWAQVVAHRFGVDEPAHNGTELRRRDFEHEALLSPFSRTIPDAVEIPRQAPMATNEQPPEAVGHEAANNYARSRGLSVAAATSADVPAIWFWQPTPASRKPLPGGRLDSDVEPTDSSRAAARAASSNLPSDVVDLSGALDTSEDAVFWDGGHTNEVGARLIAAAMFDHIRPQLDQLLEEDL